MTKAASRQPETPTPAEASAPVEPTEGEQPSLKDGGVDLEVLAVVEDGEVTFTNPGVEAKTFTVKDGMVRASEEDAAWLIAQSVARYPAAAE